MDKLKTNKSNFLLYVYSGKLTTILYYIGALTFIIPMIIISVNNIQINTYLSRTITGISAFFFILGRILVIINKKKDKMNVSTDIGIIVVFTIAIISSIINL